MLTALASGEAVLKVSSGFMGEPLGAAGETGCAAHIPPSAPWTTPRANRHFSESRELEVPPVLALVPKDLLLKMCLLDRRTRELVNDIARPAVRNQNVTMIRLRSLIIRDRPKFSHGGFPRLPLAIL